MTVTGIWPGIVASKQARLLILGGTIEARELAQRASIELSEKLTVTTSLAGRRRAQPTLAGEVRVGGFGGIVGLIEYLSENAVDLLVDATHPYSPVISNHASNACAALSIPRAQVMRPPWKLPPSARYIEVDDMKGAAKILPDIARRVFVTTGARGFEEFAELEDVFFLVRLIDAPEKPLALKNHQIILGQPPYSLDQERTVFAEHEIDLLLTKHSGGEQTAAKIFAAAECKIKTLIIRRPPPEPGNVFETVDAAMDWIRASFD